MSLSVLLRRMLLCGLFVLCAGAVQSAMASQIFGTVYDNRQNALPEVNVELLNENHALISYTRTDGIGKYSFDGIGDGNFYVRVLPFRYDLDEQVQSVEIYTISLSSNRPGYAAMSCDFVLTPRRGTLAAARAEVIYAQEVPSEARKAYEDGMKALRKRKPEEAIVQFQAAIKAFPDYYLANHYLGTTYADSRDYEHAAPPLLKASEINPKSGVTLYYLGLSLHMLNYNKAAIIALQAAAVATPESSIVFVSLGSAQRAERQYDAAEKSLLQAKKLARGESADLYRELAALYGITKRYDKAVENLERMLKAGTFSDEDAAKIKQQIKIWKELVAKQPSQPTT
jgi:Tfp pilus assembly protein PilF